ncbi:MAG: GNAT family N-acetyltransferase [bacterium]|nr:GNAT family N-acetyltransferase [bacterium]MCP5071069.1 GNAT family N-acetyltransferase [bacterium]
MIVPLEWDSAHFGFPIARVEPGNLPLTDLESDLGEASRAGLRLIYCLRPLDQTIPEKTLVRFGGRTLTASVLYRKGLEGDRKERRDELTIETLRDVPLSDDLRRLAPSIGLYSRFRLDPDIPKEAFVRMYEIWIERSLKGEIAEQVLVARGADGTTLGIVTVVRPDPQTGRIGLVGVTEAARGQGVGGALVAAAEAAMEAGGAIWAEVATQLENDAGRALYESLGYEPGTPERAHHFWLEPTQ